MSRHFTISSACRPQWEDKSSRQEASKACLQPKEQRKQHLWGLGLIMPEAGLQERRGAPGSPASSRPPLPPPPVGSLPLLPRLWPKLPRRPLALLRLLSLPSPAARELVLKAEARPCSKALRGSPPPEGKPQLPFQSHRHHLPPNPAPVTWTRALRLLSLVPGTS